ncbi:MAG: GTP-binding protein [Candidatus Binatia bacterium]
MKHVSVDILTGFLGSGKTTLLRHVLGGALAGEKVAVVMNEIGDVGIDGRVITGLDYVESMVELNSGCICCTIDDYRFDLAVRELIEAVDPTLVLIESTGVADPEPMISRVLQAGLALDAVICVVDAGAFDRARKESLVVARQVAAADFVVINKTDLVTPGELAALRRRLARLNGRAMLVDCERGQVSTDLMFGTSARRYREATPPAPARDHLHEDGIAAFTYKASAELDQARFERFLGRLPPSILRAKGFIRLAGNPWSCLFNYTCGRYELKWVKLDAEGAPSQAVFIGKEVERVRTRIERELALCEVD